MCLYMLNECILVNIKPINNLHEAISKFETLFAHFNVQQYLLVDLWSAFGSILHGT